MKSTLILCFFTFCVNYIGAQNNDKELRDTIIQLDAQFWQSYNECNVDGMSDYLSEDIEFYHDKGGLSIGKKELTTSLKENLCGNTNFKLIRQEVPGTVEIFPLSKNGEIYAGLISGAHVFYIKNGNDAPFLDGRALFSQLWLKTEGAWKMHRILSYDHGPASDTPTSIYLDKKKLEKFVGSYVSKVLGRFSITASNGYLSLITDEKTINLYPQDLLVFKAKATNTYFTFLENSAKLISDITILESGNDLDEAKKID